MSTKEGLNVTDDESIREKLAKMSKQNSLQKQCSFDQRRKMTAINKEHLFTILHIKIIIKNY